jgi:hypothetical protein
LFEKFPVHGNIQGADPELPISAIFLRTGSDPDPLKSQNSGAFVGAVESCVRSKKKPWTLTMEAWRFKMEPTGSVDQ